MAKEYITITADHETPNCTHCDHFGDDNFNCDEWCGAGRGWYGYCRTEEIDED